MSKRSAMFYVAGIAVCVAAYIFSRLEVEHECQIDFLYEDRLVWNAQTRNDEIAKSADEHNRNAVFESLVHDFVNKDIGKTHSKAVIISHSHMEGYGEGYYLATPEMDSASVSIAEKISKNSDFNYYPRTGKESYFANSHYLCGKN